MGKKYFPNLIEFKKLIIKCADNYKVYPSARMIFKEYDNIPKSNITVKNNYRLDIQNIIDSCNIKYEKKKICKNKYNREQLIDGFMEMYYYFNGVPSNSEANRYKKEINNKIPCIRTIINEFSTLDNLLKELKLIHNKIKNRKYKEEFLLNEIKRFVKEFNRIPISEDFNYLEEYPSRKTFTNNFGTFNNALMLAGFEPTKLTMKEKTDKYMNKEYLISKLKRFTRENNKNPKSKYFDCGNEDYPSRGYYKKVFGSWNNALIEAGLPINQVSHYNDDFLESEFNRFVKEHGRIPIYAEFNNSEYPSFWCYQHRFGSWNKAVAVYGYEPNDKNRKFILDDGEICASSYEFDVSMWLRENNFKYTRNIDYKDFIDGYKGKMNCDYLIDNNGELWYVEVAGFLSGTDFNKFSQEEKNYFFKLKYKRKLLKRQSNLKHKIIYAYQLKSTPLPELFSFLFD